VVNKVLTAGQRVGRPPLEPQVIRRYGVAFRVNAEERARLRTLASASGLSVSTYARRVLLGEPLRFPTVPATNLLYVHQLCRVGNNLNQLVKLLHQNRAPVGIRDVLEELITLLGDVKARLLGIEVSG